MFKTIILILTAVSVIGVIGLIAVGIFSVISAMDELSVQPVWHWHRGLRCKKCGTLYGSREFAPTYCKKCGSCKDYEGVVVRWRPFKWEVLNEEEEKH